MKIINPSYEILTPINGQQILKNIELYGRVSYKSEDKITDNSAEKFVKMLIDRGHESVLEHAGFSVRFICDRGISHEIVRHRLASYTQESTRYCNYSNNKFNEEITVILPFFFIDSYDKYDAWKSHCLQSEKAYFDLLSLGVTPEEARSVLPNSLKTDIIVTENLREWRHFLRLRTSKTSHPQMRQLTIPLLKELQSKIPVIFNDIEIND